MKDDEIPEQFWSPPPASIWTRLWAWRLYYLFVLVGVVLGGVLVALGHPLVAPPLGIIILLLWWGGRRRR